MHSQKEPGRPWSLVMTFGTGISRNGMIPPLNWKRYHPDLRTNIDAIQADGAYVTGGVAVKRLNAWKNIVVTALFEATPDENKVFNSIELAEGILEGNSSTGSNTDIIAGDTIPRCSDCYQSDDRVDAPCYASFAHPFLYAWVHFCMSFAFAGY